MGRRTLSVSVVAMLLSVCSAQADLIVTPTVAVNGPEYSYRYSLENTGTTSIIGFSVTVSALVDQIFGPDGWVSGTFPLGVQTSAQWVSSDIPFDLTPGSTLSGFMITSSAPPGIADFTAFDDSFNFIEGQTAGPVAATVPEPGTIVLLGTVLAGIGLWRWRNRAIRK